MSRDYRLYLDDILECCEKIADFTAGMTFEAFSKDARTIDAVVRNIEIIGEAVKNVPIEWLDTQPEIDWKKIARLRDLIVHRYFRVELEIIWTIIRDRIPELQNSVRSLLDGLELSDPK